MIVLMLRMLVFIALIVGVFALWVSYTYGITLHDWWENQKNFYLSDEKSDEEKERDLKKEIKKE